MFEFLWLPQKKYIKPLRSINHFWLVTFCARRFLRQTFRYRPCRKFSGQAACFCATRGQNSNYPQEQHVRRGLHRCMKRGGEGERRACQCTMSSAAKSRCLMY